MKGRFWGVWVHLAIALTIGTGAIAREDSSGEKTRRETLPMLITQCSLFLESDHGGPILTPNWYGEVDNRIRSRSVSMAGVRALMDELAQSPRRTLWEVNLVMLRLLELSPFPPDSSFQSEQDAHNLLVMKRFLLARGMRLLNSTRLEIEKLNNMGLYRDPRVATERTHLTSEIYGEESTIAPSRKMDLVAIGRLALIQARESTDFSPLSSAASVPSASDLLAVIVALKLEFPHEDHDELIGDLRSLLDLEPPRVFYAPRSSFPYEFSGPIAIPTEPAVKAE